MKQVYFFLFTLLISTLLNAQTSGGPDAYGYTWKNSNHASNPPVYGWFDITTIGTQVTGLADDNVVGPFSASSGFQFYWYPTNQFWIGSNGYISFNGDNIASPFPAAIPSGGGANNFIAPLLSDLNFTGLNNPAQCWYYSTADTLCVSYLDVPFWENSSTGYTGSNSFQIILNKVDKSITFNYLKTSLGNVTSLDNAVGIENNTGTLGLSTHIDVLPADTFTVKFYYPSVVTYQVKDGGVDWNGNPDNAGIFVKKQGGPYTLKANVKNYGNQAIGGFTVRDSVVNSSNSVVSSGSLSLPSLAVGSDTTIVFSNTFSPSAAGTYRFQTAVNISGDIYAGNDGLTQEIIAVDTSLANIKLDYSDGLADGGGLGWNGGNGGIGIYIEPPFYPAKVTSSQFYISADGSSVGFYAKIFDDDGPGGTVGTLLDSVYVAGSSITLNTYTNVPTANTNLVIDSGGIYLLWYMGGAGINIARDITPPISRRTYEVLGTSWAGYRDLLTEDFLMGISIKNTKPVANFQANLAADPQVSFTDLTTNNPTAWFWDFDDNGDTSHYQNPVHTFANNGIHNVCLTATNVSGSNTICKLVNINKVAPIADFSVDLSNDPVIQFSDLSQNIPIGWFWTFGDGNTSNQPSPAHTYLANGNFSVCLTVTNPGGTDSMCKTISIANALPVANFTYTTANMPTVNFQDQSSVSPTSWLWDFDDSGVDTSIAQNPDYTFKANGSHNVCLTVWNAAGSSQPFCQSITVTGVGINNAAQDNWTLCPNPVSTSQPLYIRGKAQISSTEIEVMNMIGEHITVKVATMSRGALIDISGFTPGIYFVKFTSNQGTKHVMGFVVSN